MSKYKVYDRIPTPEAIALRFGAASTLLEAFQRMLAAHSYLIPATYNAIYNSYMHANDTAAIGRDLMPVAAMLVEESGRMALAEPTARWLFISRSFQAQLARQLRDFYPDMHGTPVEEAQ